MMPPLDSCPGASGDSSQHAHSAASAPAILRMGASSWCPGECRMPDADCQKIPKSKCQKVERLFRISAFGLLLPFAIGHLALGAGPTCSHRRTLMRLLMQTRTRRRRAVPEKTGMARLADVLFLPLLTLSCLRSAPAQSALDRRVDHWFRSPVL